MLRSFEGVIDSQGLRSLRQDDGRCPIAEASSTNGQLPFWAILDTNDATRILRELLSGNRRQALLALEELAVTLGSNPRLR